MLTGFMQFMSYLGSAAFYVPLLLALFWCVAPRLAARAAVVLLFGAVVNTILKLVFHAPRPYWTDPSVDGRQSLTSFGMPSGHSQNSVAGWGFFAAQTRRWILWAGAAVVVFLIGLSRVYLGVHSIGQVLAGWGIGLALLVAVLGLEPIVVPWWTRQHLAAQMALSLGVSLLLLAAAWGALQPLQDWQWPQAWSEAIQAAGGVIGPITLTDSAQASGALCGTLMGLSLCAARGWFDPGGKAWQRLARLPVGLAGTAVIAFFQGTSVVQAFVVQALLALWVTAGAPEVFVRLGLSARPTPGLTRAGDERAGQPQ
ncbi:phosphatase PAP2 family protein [Actinomadura darangshiensis]|uniref:Phosphatase PAP2 family protein n=1 Tax=Actinomadura darangshiensis TaxID=705336 RepID=A0A4R5C1L8_9ACTN|nr:phosphatase PAP2 family protein [Actinomadura darangshiensis]TDD90684.1 phosphatase PAP2 family protein [Actinomadura darangshiensis]